MTIGYASNERHAYTTSSPASHVAWMICPSTPTLPVPVAMCDGSTPTASAMAAVSSVTAMSGYRLTSRAARSMTFRTLFSGG